MPTVLVIGTMDTKGPESAFVVECLREAGCRTLIMDVGILDSPRGLECDITREAVAAAAGASLGDLQQSGSRGRAGERMCHGARAIASELVAQRRLSGAIALGGAEGSVLAAAAMQQLPLGMPRLIVSPILSGQRQFAPFVGTSDACLMHSVVDILGLNSISTEIFANAAAMVAGAALAYEARSAKATPSHGRRQYAATMLGNSTRALMRLKSAFEPEFGDLVIFHANGVGGAALEQLVRAGRFDGVIDFTLSEIVGDLVGGFHRAGPSRLEAACRRGLPQVVVPGCVDFVVVGPLAQLPDAWRDRPVYYHNPEFTLVRVTKDEQVAVARQIARKLNAARGPVCLVVPTRGLSVPNCAADHDGQPGPFWAPDVDAAFREELAAALAPHVAYREVEAHLNDDTLVAASLQAAREIFV